MSRLPASLVTQIPMFPSIGLGSLLFAAISLRERIICRAEPKPDFSGYIRGTHEGPVPPEGAAVHHAGIPSEIDRSDLLRLARVTIDVVLPGFSVHSWYSGLLDSPRFPGPLAGGVGIVLPGLVLGTAQWWVLRQYTRRAGLWFAATTARITAGLLYFLLDYEVLGSYMLDDWIGYPLITATVGDYADARASSCQISELLAALWVFVRFVAVSMISLVGGIFVVIVLGGHGPFEIPLFVPFSQDYRLPLQAGYTWGLCYGQRDKQNV